MIYIFLGANTSDCYLGIVQFYTGTKPDGDFLLFVDNFFKAIVTMLRGAMQNKRGCGNEGGDEIWQKY